MTYDFVGASALNYAPCRYGRSRLLFRGPERNLEDPYVAIVGGTEIYGKFIREPVSEILEAELDTVCVNLGISNAGVDVFLNDDFLIEAANRAQVSVLQVVGAQNLSNKFYTVHPRRNDRFVCASPTLKAMYPEVDFSEINFTRHLVTKLHDVSKERFAAVRAELQRAWIARMKLLLRNIGGEVLLLWFADHAPMAEICPTKEVREMQEPLFVTQAMLDDLAAFRKCYVEVVASQDALADGTKGMVFNEVEVLAADQMLGPRAHDEAAKALGAVVRQML